MAETTAINNPIIDMIQHLTYAQKVAKTYGENVNTEQTQTRIQTRKINKKMDFLAFNLEKMIDLPKISNFDRTEATSISLGLDRIRQTFSTLEKDDIRNVLEILQVLRK